MEFVPDWDTIRLLPHLPGDARWCSATWSGSTTRPSSSRRAPSSSPSSTRSPSAGWSRWPAPSSSSSRSTRRTRTPPDALPRPRPGQPVQRRLLDPRHHAGRAAAARHPQHHVRRRAWTSRAPRASATSASTRSASSTPTRWSPRTTTASTRPSPRRSPPSTGRRSRSWRSTTSARAAPATSTCRCAARTATSCSGTADAAADAAVRQLRRRRARDDARLHAALRPEHQLLQAVRRRLVRADRDRVGRGQPHLRRAPGRARPERPDGEPRARRRREPVPRARGDAGRRPARHRAGARARAGAGGQRLPSDKPHVPHTLREARDAFDVLGDRPGGVRRRRRRPLHEHGRRRARRPSTRR